VGLLKCLQRTPRGGILFRGGVAKEAGDKGKGES